MGTSVSANTLDSSAGQHRDALDGVRGVAITLVILFHSLKVSSGWAGVQIFFVLSGFLITTILLRESQLSLDFYLKRFYWRRSLRIFPLYFGYLIVLAIVYAAVKAPSLPPPGTSLWAMPMREGITTFGRDWPYLFTYTLNFRRVFPDFGGSNPYYGRFWTLAVEEQFYLVWPLLVYFFPRKYFVQLLGAILIVAPICRALSAHFLRPVLHDPSVIGAAVYYLTPGQMDSFAVGAALVLFWNRLRHRSLAIFIGATLLLLACGQMASMRCSGHPAINTGLGYNINMICAYQHVWGYTLINVWAGALILAASTRTWISKLMALPWLAYIGRISYGMYVYHHIILFAGVRKFGTLIDTPLGFTCYFLCVVLVSDLSYRLYESRFLKLKDTRFSRPKRLVNQAPILAAEAQA